MGNNDSSQYKFNVLYQYATNIDFNTAHCPPGWGDEALLGQYTFLMLS